MTAPQYASKQPQGFKNFVEKVAVVGAGGQVGEYIVKQLVKNGKHKITAITRVDSANKIPDGVEVKKVDYNDQASLVEALQGQDVLLITMGVLAPPDQQSKLIEAAAIANVPWVLPNEFGGDGTNDQINQDVILGVGKKKVREHIEQLGKSSWIGIDCGFWYEFSLAGGVSRYGFDFENRTALFLDDGLTKLTTSTWPQIGRAIANLLALKVLPDDENDTSPCLENFRNKFLHLGSFTINQQEMLESLMRVTGTGPNDWSISKVPVEEYFNKACEELQAGDREAFARRLYSRSFFPDHAGDSSVKFGLDNDKLGLPKEDLDEFTKLAVQMVEDKYFQKRYGN